MAKTVFLHTPVTERWWNVEFIKSEMKEKLDTLVLKEHSHDVKTDKFTDVKAHLNYKKK